MWLLTINKLYLVCKLTIDLELEAIESSFEGPLIFSKSLWTAILSPITGKSSFRCSEVSSRKDEPDILLLLSVSITSESRPSLSKYMYSCSFDITFTSLAIALFFSQSLSNAQAAALCSCFQVSTPYNAHALVYCFGALLIELPGNSHER